MRKIRLDVEALEVESFVIGAEGGGGTVRGNNDDEQSALFGSCDTECGQFCIGATLQGQGCGGQGVVGSGYNTCATCGNTCREMTCGRSCAGTCDASCGISCIPCDTYFDCTHFCL